MITTQTAALVAEIERLTECLRYEQHRAGRRGTHGTDCYKWGSEHYECAMRQVDRLTNQARVLSAAVDRTEKELAEAKQDAELYRWLRPRMMGADFDWNESGAVCLVFEMPPDTRFSADCDKTIAEAMRRTDAGAKTG